MHRLGRTDWDAQAEMHRLALSRGHDAMLNVAVRMVHV
jgi:hypothetical protein